MKTRVQAFALAGVLALTALTGGAAVLGLSHWGAKAGPASTPAVQVVQPAPVAGGEPEGWD